MVSSHIVKSKHALNTMLKESKTQILTKASNKKKGTMHKLFRKQKFTPPRVIHEHNFALLKKCHINIDMSHVDIIK